MKPKRVPRSAAIPLFLGGALLEGAVLIIAFWSSLAPLFDAPTAAVRPTQTVPTATEPTRPVAAGGMAAIQARITEGHDELRTICWNNFRTPGAGTLPLKLSIAADGTVAEVQVESPSAPLKACLEAEIALWAFPAPGRTMNVDQRLRFD